MSTPIQPVKSTVPVPLSQPAQRNAVLTPVRTPEPYAFSQQQLIERGAPVRDVVRESGAQIVQDTQHVDPLQMQQHAQNLAPLNLQLQQRLMLTDRPWSEMVTQQDAARHILTDVRSHQGEAAEPGTMGAMLFNIRGGGQASLTNVRDNQGQIKTDLPMNRYMDVQGKVSKFYQYAQHSRDILGQNGISLETPLPLFRGVSSATLAALDVGQSFQDVLPSSTSMSEHFSKTWQGDNKVLIKIPATLGYPAIMMDFPPGYQPGAHDPNPVGLKGQFEVILAPSEYRIKSKTIEGDVTVFEVEAVPLNEQQALNKIYAARDVAFPPQVQPQLNLAEEVQAFRDKPKMIAGKISKINAFSQKFPNINWNEKLAELFVLNKHFGEDYTAMQQSPIFPPN